jgi:hypothetical protein
MRVMLMDKLYQWTKGQCSTSLANGYLIQADQRALLGLDNWL